MSQSLRVKEEEATHKEGLRLPLEPHRTVWWKRIWSTLSTLSRPLHPRRSMLEDRVRLRVGLKNEGVRNDLGRVETVEEPGRRRKERSQLNSRGRWRNGRSSVNRLTCALGRRLKYLKM